MQKPKPNYLMLFIFSVKCLSPPTYLDLFCQSYKFKNKFLSMFHLHRKSVRKLWKIHIIQTYFFNNILLKFSRVRRLNMTKGWFRETDLIVLLVFSWIFIKFYINIDVQIKSYSTACIIFGQAIYNLVKNVNLD